MTEQPHEAPRDPLYALSDSLSPNQRRHLRALAHQLKPVVWVGQRGVVEGVVDNVEAALVAHELVKIKVLDAEMIIEAAEQLCSATGATLVQRIGKMLVFFRRNEEQPKVELPSE